MKSRTRFTTTFLVTLKCIIATVILVIIIEAGIFIKYLMKLIMMGLILYSTGSIKAAFILKQENSFNAIKFKIKHLDKEFELRLETNEDSTDEEVARNNNKETKLKHYKFNRFEEKDGITR